MKTLSDQEFVNILVLFWFYYFILMDYSNYVNFWLFLPLFFYITVGLTIGEGNGTPLQYSCLENPMDGGAW